MRSRNLWYVVLLAAVVAISVFFVSRRELDHPAAEQVPDIEIDRLDAEHEIPEEGHGHLDADNDHTSTSVRGPLQQRLAATFPDSFKKGVDIFWGPHDGWISPEVYE